tara:strand:+ start:125 stop:457 length:333 start_codon:yes stop_codon:yes gene_type:complete
MEIKKKMKILTSGDRRNFFDSIFCIWIESKQKLPNKLVCFWCEEVMEPKEYFKNPLHFAVSRGGEIFESPTKGHKYFNKLYQDTFNAELCHKCFYDLDMYNKTGIWFKEG